MSINKLIQHNIAVLDDLRIMLNVIDDDRYARTDQPDMRSSIGKHVCHIMDHYSCFLAGLDQQAINYDLRERDENTQNSRSVARSRVLNAVLDLEQLNSEKRTSQIPDSLSITCSTSCNDAATLPVDSTCERELIYLHNHLMAHCYSL